ncbi:MAG: hypothetical protein ACFE8E_10525 [Candidatus Hodarchaeota archaeon]
MNNKNIINFVAKLIMLYSVLLGPIYTFFSFTSPIIPEYYYSWFMNIEMIATYTTMSFIIFVFVFLLTIRYIEKISNKLTVLISLMITSLILIYLAVGSMLEIYIILTILSGALFGFTIPVTMKFIAEDVFLGQETNTKVITTLIIVGLYIIVSFLIFNYFGLIYWRLIYLITGIIMVIFTFILAKFTAKES